MFFRTVQFRLMLILSLITFILMTVVWVFLNIQVEIITYDQFKNDIKDNYQVLNITQDMSVEDLVNTLQTDNVITGLIRGVDKSFTVIDQKTGSIVYSSDPMYKESGPLFRSEIFKSVNLISVMSGLATGERRSYTRGANGDFYDYVMLQQLAENRDVVLYFKYSRDRALRVLDQFNNVILTGTFIAMISALFIGFLLSRTITKPITDLMHKAESMTTGEFGQLLHVHSQDEIGDLTRTFNSMSSQLKGMITEVSSEKSKVETIINHMTDGIVAFSIEGNLLHINPAAQTILKSISDKMDIQAFMQHFHLDITLADLQSEEAVKACTRVVQDKERFIRLQFAAFLDVESRVEGLVIVLQDITEEQRVDNMRRQFVADVSHELRTPLTSVKSYTETLLDGALEDEATARRFLQVVVDETDRMTRLVKDLLQLSQHDNGILLNYQLLKPDQLIASCISRLRLAAEEKNITLSFNNMCSDLYINGDKDRLEQVLLNIVGNAIKYTPPHGKVDVLLTRDLQNAIIRVQDNGVGVPKEDLNRIFERFYRVDKARSRQMGGTGLGLAIAKEIVDMHKGSIQANSPLVGDNGTEIILRFPIKAPDSGYDS